MVCSSLGTDVEYRAHAISSSSSSSSFLSFSIAQIRGQIPVSLRSSVPYHRDRDKILKLPTPHGLGGFGLEKATQYLTQVKPRSSSCSSSRLHQLQVEFKSSHVKSITSSQSRQVSIFSFHHGRPAAPPSAFPAAAGRHSATPRRQSAV